MSKHTPTPWYHSGETQSAPIMSRAGGIVATPNAPFDSQPGEMQANAELIVRAVNNHAALLSELCKAQKIIANALNLMTPEQKQQWAHRNAATDCDGEGTTRAHERLAVIEAAK